MPTITGQLRARSQTLWTLLRWEGQLRNSRLRDVLGIQKVQVSRLISQFAAENPRSVILDSREKVWRLNDEDLAIEHGGGFEEYRALCQSDTETPISIVDARIDFLPPRPKLVSTLSAACRDARGLEVLYRSRSSPDGSHRVIFPTAIVRLSQRWHARAWCATRRDYRDFNLGRIDRWQLIDTPRPSGAGADQAWDTVLSIRIGAHEALSAADALMVRKEYFGGAASMRVKSRGALVPYVLQEARVATDATQHKPPEYLLQVMNPKTIAPYLFSSPSQNA